MNRIQVSLLTLLLITLAPVISARDTSPLFSYAFLIKTGENDVAAIGEADTRITVGPGAGLKIYLKPEENVYIYLFLHDAGGDLHLIFPRFFKEFDDTTYPGGKGMYIPRGLRWFPFTGAGEERFYLMASSKRLKTIEENYLYYEKSKKNGDTSAIEDSRQQVIGEMKKLMLDHFALVQKVKPQIHLVSGEFRGTGEIEEFPAISIAGISYYSRIIRINH